MHIPTMIGGLPAMSAIASKMMEAKMEKLDIPPIHEFIEMISDTGAGMYACRASVDLFGFTRDDFVDHHDGWRSGLDRGGDAGTRAVRVRAVDLMSIDHRPGGSASLIADVWTQPVVDVTAALAVDLERGLTSDEFT